MPVTTDTMILDNRIVHSQDPATNAFAITPSDTNYLADANDKQFHTRGIMVTVAGNVVCIFAGDTAAVTLPLLAGVLYPFAIKKVNQTNTTATGILGFR